MLAREPMTGERDVRSEDRQLLLDAIGAATEKLVITYTGANEYTGHVLAAVPLAELLDALDTADHRRPVRESIRGQVSVAALRCPQRNRSALIPG